MVDLFSSFFSRRILPNTEEKPFLLNSQKPQVLNFNMKTLLKYFSDKGYPVRLLNTTAEFCSDVMRC